MHLNLFIKSTNTTYDKKGTWSLKKKENLHEFVELNYLPFVKIYLFQYTCLSATLITFKNVFSMINSFMCPSTSLFMSKTVCSSIN